MRMKAGFLGLCLASCVACSASVACADAVRYVDEFDLSASRCGFGLATQARKSVRGNPLTMGEKTYERGIGAIPEGAVAFRANGKVTAFDAIVGVDADAKRFNASGYEATVVFKVWKDGRIAYDSKDTTEKTGPKVCHVDLEGATEIILETASGYWKANECSHGDWADARFTLADGGTVEPLPAESYGVQLGILTPPEKPAPQFNGADVWGVRPGHEVIFRVPVSGIRPMKLAAHGLPDGVTFDAAKGVLRGTAPQTTGDYRIEVVAANAHGKAKRMITLRVGETICLTPPMGWNSWNVWGWLLTQEHAERAARAMDETGLADHGWSYVNLDDWWSVKNKECRRGAQRKIPASGVARDGKGRINPNPGFPDMNRFTKLCHDLGLKAGLYTSPGNLTCGECEGSGGYELLDAQRFAEWGFDYLKYDNCSYRDVEKAIRETCRRRPTPEEQAAPYYLMGRCLRSVGRDIVYALCQYGSGDSETWARAVGGNAWRVYGDLKDGWNWMWAGLNGRHREPVAFTDYTGPGCWADPDMMLIGLQRSFGSEAHPTYLTPNEQYTHVSLWSIVNAPLLLGCDLEKLDAFTKSLVVNDEVIAVNQDALGMRPKRVVKTDGLQVWTKEISDGFLAVAIVNLSPLRRDVSIRFADLGLGSECKVKDLWRQRCEGGFADAYTCSVEAHATKFVKMKPACLSCDEKKGE